MLSELHFGNIGDMLGLFSCSKFRPFPTSKVEGREGELENYTLFANGPCPLP